MSNQFKDPLRNTPYNLRPPKVANLLNINRNWLSAAAIKRTFRSSVINEGWSNDRYLTISAERCINPGDKSQDQADHPHIS